MRNCSAPAFTRSIAVVMLPLVSSITATVIGVGLFSNTLTACGLPLSRTSKSPCVRSGTSRLVLSVTVT